MYVCVSHSAAPTTYLHLLCMRRSDHSLELCVAVYSSALQYVAAYSRERYLTHSNNQTGQDLFKNRTSHDSSYTETLCPAHCACRVCVCVCVCVCAFHTRTWNCNTLQHTATKCTQQHTATNEHCNSVTKESLLVCLYSRVSESLLFKSLCNTLQQMNTATHCNKWTLQHTATKESLLASLYSKVWESLSQTLSVFFVCSPMQKRLVFLFSGLLGQSWLKKSTMTSPWRSTWGCYWKAN